MRNFVSRFVPRGSVVLAVTTLGSYILGLVRDRMFAHTFGASTELDSYNAAFLIPDFMFNLLVASGIGAAVVPLFLQLRQKNQRDAYHYLNSLLLAATATMLVTGVLLLLLAPYLAPLVVPGLAPESQHLVVQLMRILALAPIIFAASNTLGALLVAQKRFLFYGLSPLLYNLGIIVGTLTLAPAFGVMGIALGALLGAGLHLLIRIIDALRSGWRPALTLWMPPGYWRQTLKLMAPKMFGHPVELVTFWIFTSLASLLAPGSISVLNFARNFQSVPVSLLGIAMSTAVFPSLAEAALSSFAELKKILHRTAFAIVTVSSLAALAMFAIRRPLVERLLEGGAFDTAAASRTALTLGVFCLSIPTESLSHLLARAFYAKQNTITPVILSVASLVVAGLSAWLLIGRLGIIGLPLGFFFGSAIKTAGLYGALLRNK